jgi:PleD family two-component response regulator
LKTSFSAGIAGYPIHGRTSDSILQAADKGLYRAKNSGRNRVILSAVETVQKEEEQ